MVSHLLIIFPFLIIILTCDSESVDGEAVVEISGAVDDEVGDGVVNDSVVEISGAVDDEVGDGVVDNSVVEISVLDDSVGDGLSDGEVFEESVEEEDGDGEAVVALLPVGGDGAIG